jgi:hypothetical protein
MHELDPNQPAGGDCIIGRLKTLTPAQARADVLEALEEACRMAESDAQRLGGATHGRYLAAAAKRWRDVISRLKASGA